MINSYRLPTQEIFSYLITHIHRPSITASNFIMDFFIISFYFIMDFSIISFDFHHGFLYYFILFHDGFLYYFILFHDGFPHFRLRFPCHSPLLARRKTPLPPAPPTSLPMGGPVTPSCPSTFPRTRTRSAHPRTTPTLPWPPRGWPSKRPPAVSSRQPLPFYNSLSTGDPPIFFFFFFISSYW